MVFRLEIFICVTSLVEIFCCVDESIEKNHNFDYLNPFHVPPLMHNGSSMTANET